MKAILLILVSSLTMNFTCNKEMTDNAIPACITAKIEAIKAQPKWNPPAEVTEYSYEGKTVYGFSADCCDQYYEVYDKDCNFICAPSGGITGAGDGKCREFSAKAKVLRVLYK